MKNYSAEEHDLKMTADDPEDELEDEDGTFLRKSATKRTATLC
jgi:hypothetical protein